jgi:uncharacterized membrane protein
MFTDLEYILMVAVAVLLWRNQSMKTWAMYEKYRANKYANWLVGVYEKKGKIVQKDDGYFFEEIK